MNFYSDKLPVSNILLLVLNNCRLMGAIGDNLYHNSTTTLSGYLSTIHWGAFELAMSNIHTSYKPCSCDEWEPVMSVS